jgi:hypothetical protein
MDPARRSELEQGLMALLLRHGAQRDGLAEGVRAAIDHSLEAFAATAGDGRSLSPLDVLRIRLGKFAATCVPPALFRDAPTLAALRREIHTLSVRALPPELTRGSRF